MNTRSCESTEYHRVCEDPTINRQRMSISAGFRSANFTTRTSSFGPETGPETLRPITTGMPGSRWASSSSRIAPTCQVRVTEAGL
ncbi:bifunctional S-adenosyl-L-methionine-precorrin-2 methyl transferase/precorrin-3 methylase [Mycobacterium tuberculosis]|uniref:Uncharacterized protein n=1 Tax=Mycobacterium tuberculosis TaxID=1773 RepID=A0A655JU49_MYCTX|nr:bifunctional S-adenosyl-L-methionine-precorrin-2 methyl transferase/precorrin-3 methylase [Mycobacterium tuberculosis]COY04493.1 Uncharacterised protein [Mycobacterium tuberculosis]COZ70993.1 Uncharacterised protein [Mycobacterium tuberculosis]